MVNIHKILKENLEISPISLLQKIVDINKYNEKNINDIITQIRKEKNICDIHNISYFVNNNIVWCYNCPIEYKCDECNQLAKQNKLNKKKSTYIKYVYCCTKCNKKCFIYK